MIRFRTIDPAEQARADEKAAAAKPAVAAPAQAGPAAGGQQSPEDAADDPAPPKAKGLARKTPLRAKKPETSGLFRD